MEHAGQSGLAAARPARVELLVVELINRLLDADIRTADARIDEVLARLGTACGLRRSFLLQSRPDGSWTSSHEWLAASLNGEDPHA